MSDYTTYELERMAVGELDVPPDAAERVAEMQRENEDLLARYPADEVVPRIRASSPRRPRRAPVVLALCGLAVTLLVVVWPNEVVRPERVEPRVRLKGPSVRLHIYKESPAGEVPLTEGAEVAAGDVVQARFGIAVPAFVAHYSVDGTGTITAIEPATLGAETVRYEGGTHRAPTATELDDNGDFERFVVVACDESYVTRELVDRVNDGNAPAGCEVEMVELRK